MGRSPGKWIKTLFGKKSSKSQLSKKNPNDREWNDGKESSGLGSPVISQPIPVNDSRNGTPVESEVVPQSSLPTGQTGLSPPSEDVRKQASAVPDNTNDPQRAKLEKAAIKAQAAFRGYLARRAFRALRGIIRLQAVMRGHLVRRQAVATFQCTMGIVKLQAHVRGRKVRLSNEKDAKYYRAISVTAKNLDSSTFGISYLKMKFSGRIFIYKLLSGTPVGMPLQMQYVDGEPNSVKNWLERWSLYRFWKPLPKPKKAVALKPHSKHNAFTIETESGRPKRSVRRNFSSNIDHGNTNAVAESEKAKRNPRKYLISQSEVAHENPQSELEKVKRNLRKITNSATMTSGQADEEAEKLKLGLRRVLNPPVEENKEKMEKEAAALPLATEVKPILENGSKSEQDLEQSLASDPKPVEASTSTTDHNVAPDPLPLQGIVLDENHPVVNEDLIPIEDQCRESQKASRRRASFSKSDYPENTLQDTPKLPSYMAATESAKAKLRGQLSPRVSSDVVDKNGVTRRHSLPTSTNGKLTSQSPRIQRIAQTTGGKGGTKGERSFSSSEDDKPIQVEWRR